MDQASDASNDRQCRAYCAPRSSDKGLLKRCTRHSKSGSLFCGTHSTNQPNGFMSDADMNNPLERVEVVQRCIRGIYYHLDNESNVYDTNDILDGVTNPRVVGTYTVVEPAAPAAEGKEDGPTYNVHIFHDGSPPIALPQND